VAAWTAWAAFCLFVGLPTAFRGWSGAVAALGSVGWREVLAARPLHALAAHAQVLGIALAVAAAWAGYGAPVLAWLGTPAAKRWERAALALLLGFAALGAALLGVALAGLFAPAVVAVAALAGLALPGARAAVAAAARARPRLPATGRRWVVLGLAPVLIPLLAALTPDVQMDSYTYHLAVPEQILRVHKFTAEGLSLSRGYTLAAELVYSAAVIPGRDSVAHWLNIIAFAGAVSLLAGWVSRLAGPAAGWLAAGAIATMGFVVQMAMVAKNDLAAAAYPLAGVVCLARGWPGLAAVLLGCGGAAKWNGLLFAALALPALWRGGVRRSLGRTCLVAFPVLPWLLRSWLWAGDPVWPALSRWIPGALWDAPSQEAMTIMRHPWGGLAAGLLAAPPALFRAVVAEAPGLALLVPFALAGGLQARWTVWYAAAGLAGCAVAMPFQWIRLALPAVILLAEAASAGAVRTAARWPERRRIVAAAALALVAWLPAGGFVTSADPARRLPALTGAWSEDRFLSESLTTYRVLARNLGRLPGCTRLVGFSDIRHYRLPGRYLEERCYGGTWGWTLARESATPERIRIRWRQLGIRYAIENVVNEGLPHAAAAPFRWDSRMLAVWRAFVGRYLEVAVPPPEEDDRNGGFVAWTVRARPLDREPGWLPSLPGIDAVVDEVTRHGLTGDAEGWISSARVLASQVPNVDFVGSLAAVGYYSLGRYAEAYGELLAGVQHGSVADGNFWMAGASALMLGRRADARRCFVLAAAFDADHRAGARIALDRLR